MLFCAISEEKTGGAGAPSLCCRKYRVEGKEMLTFRDTIPCDFFVVNFGNLLTFKETIHFSKAK